MKVMNALQVVNSCLTWSGLTKSGRGEIPLLFHGVVGQVQEKLPLFVWELEPRSINLTTTATMVGGTQLLKGAHLTGAHTP